MTVSEETESLVKEVGLCDNGKSYISITPDNTIYIVNNFGGKKVWRNSAFETLAKKILANPRLTCIF